MSSRSRALFLDLLSDLSPHLEPDVVQQLADGIKVEMWPGMSLPECQALCLANSFFKKLKDVIKPDADARALEKFLSVNKTVGAWTPRLQTSWDEVLYGELKRSLYDFWYPEGEPLVSSLDDLVSHLACGPGAAVGSTGGDFYTKLFSSRLTATTSSLPRVYENYIANFPEWSNAEIIRKEHKGSAKIVAGNRLQFVPKTCDISRVICIEPILNMGFQLGMGHFLEKRLRSSFGINLSTQPEVNRELARVGSLLDVYSTIDLESASDSMSLEMLRSVLPRDFFSYLMLLRSPCSELPQGSRVALNMVSTMGNGFTFPLQTALFACIVRAAARARDFHLGRPLAASHCSWSVFGDDIIVPTGCHYDVDRKIFVNYGHTLRRDVYRLLDLLGFVVNRAKSFSEGPFRESCGTDWFSGQPVRGVYLKTLQTTQSRFVAINALNRWSAQTGLSLGKTVKTLLRSVPFTPVPPWESDDAGVKVPYSFVRNRRRNKDLQSVIYRKWVIRPRYLTIGDGVVLGSRPPIYNPSGLLIAFLNGTIRSCKIGVRNVSNLYRGCFGVAPNWDHNEAVPAYQAGGQRWNSAVATNIR